MLVSAFVAARLRALGGSGIRSTSSSGAFTVDGLLRERVIKWNAFSGGLVRGPQVSRRLLVRHHPLGYALICAGLRGIWLRTSWV